MALIDRYDNTHGRIAAVGMFDGVHGGHRCLLDTLSAHGHRLGLQPVAVTFRNHPRTLTSGDTMAMLSTLDEKLRRLEAEGVDVILLDFDEDLRMMSAGEFMAMLARDYGVEAMVIGFNNRFGHDRPDSIEAYGELGKKCGIKVFAADEFKCGSVSKVSSSAIRSLLGDGRVEEAACLLGRPYVIEGSVVHGKELGRKLGFPTANIEPLCHGILVPANGVYAVRVALADGSVWPGMLNIGHRPTVDGDDAPRSIEVHIIGFDGDIYGSLVAVEFVAFLRHEQAFTSLEALKGQLAADARRTVAAVG